VPWHCGSDPVVLAVVGVLVVCRFASVCAISSPTALYCRCACAAPAQAEDRSPTFGQSWNFTGRPNTS